jgi:hypothetical protein
MKDEDFRITNLQIAHAALVLKELTQRKIIKELSNKNKELTKQLNIASVDSRRELLIATLQSVKGVTIPDTNEGVISMVNKYSNL